MTPPENQIYIRPTLHIHPNLAAAKEFSDTYGAYHFWESKPFSSDLFLLSQFLRKNGIRSVVRERLFLLNFSSSRSSFE